MVCLLRIIVKLMLIADEATWVIIGFLLPSLSQVILRALSLAPESVSQALEEAVELTGYVLSKNVLSHRNWEFAKTKDDDHTAMTLLFSFD